MNQQSHTELSYLHVLVPTELFEQHTRFHHFCFRYPSLLCTPNDPRNTGFAMIPRPQSHSKALGPGVTGPELLVPTSAPLERPPAATPLAPSCGAHAFMVDPTAVPAVNPAADPSRQHTKYPYVTGTSVLGVKYRDGVLIAADMLGAYGSTKRYKSMQRVVKVRANS